MQKKKKKHLWLCILGMNMKNLQWKHILIVNGLTTLFTIDLPSYVGFARFG